jgi:hypothetical protein|tara:strand:- start:1100 stop:1330 length:231 start_codon:yes stop_codon:yes gene_type:complete
MTFNNFFNTDFTTFNNNGIELFKSMLQSKGFKEARSDWFQCGSTSAIKYVFRNETKFVSFSHDNNKRIEVSNYGLN